MHLVAKSRMPDSLDTNKCVCWTIEHGILSDPNWHNFLWYLLSFLLSILILLNVMLWLFFEICYLGEIKEM